MKVRDLFNEAVKSRRYSAEFYEHGPRPGVDVPFLDQDVSLQNGRVTLEDGQRLTRALASSGACSGYEQVGHICAAIAASLDEAHVGQSLSFELVSGDEIGWAYHQENASDVGGLGESCMKHPRCQEYLGIYKENRQVSLAVVKGDDDIVKARCLVWDELFSDRVYDSGSMSRLFMESKLFEMGLLNAWRNDNVRGSVRLDKTDFDFYPYMDSFYNICDGFVNNDPLKRHGVVGVAKSTRGTLERTGICGTCGVHCRDTLVALRPDGVRAHVCEACSVVDPGFAECDDCGGLGFVSKVAFGESVCTDCFSSYIDAKEFARKKRLKLSSTLRSQRVCMVQKERLVFDASKKELCLRSGELSQIDVY